MSRSHRHFPACGITTARSEGWWKTWLHQSVRQRNRMRLAAGWWDWFWDYHKVGHWGPKDGRQIFDREEWGKLMRK